MSAKTLTPEELRLQQLVPEIDRNSDPYQRELSEQIDEYNKETKKHDKISSELNNLEKVPKPKEPQPVVKDTAMTCYGLSAAAVVLLFLFHCVIWVLKLLFNISWDTWGWTVNTFWFGLIASTVITICAYLYDQNQKDNYEKKFELWEIYDSKKTELTTRLKVSQKALKQAEWQLNNLISKQCAVLVFAIKNVMGIPCPPNAVKKENYQRVKGMYLNIKQKQDYLNKLKANNEDVSQRQLELVNLKLAFFYSISLAAEIQPDVYNEFAVMLRRNAVNDNKRRCELPKGKGRYNIEDLPDCKRMLNDDSLSPVIEKFEAVSNRDTSNDILFFMTSTKKKAQQTREMQNLVGEAKEVYDHLKKINEKVSYALNYARACAYRNLYLGAELINYVRTTKGGTTLTTVKDGTDMVDLGSQMTQVDLSNCNTNVMDAALNTLSDMGTTVLNNDYLMKTVLKNPKMSAGIAAVAAIGSSAVSYFENLSTNADAQKDMVHAIHQIADGYVEGKANMLRAIEIIGAIVKCNDGFMSIYEPLRKRVFEQGDINLSKQDIVLLADAINKYKKVTDSKIK